jgi:hypothetical protein
LELETMELPLFISLVLSRRIRELSNLVIREVFTSKMLK